MKNGKTKWMWAAAMLGSLGCSPGAWAFTPSVDATITVTPIVNVSLSVSPTTYAFGQLAINTSSVTSTSLTLSNNGDVDAVVSKQIQSDPTDWVGDTTTSTPNHYVLYVATSTTRPNVSDFNAGNHELGSVGNSTALKGLGGSTPVITAGGATPNVALWFRLDTPQSVTTSAAQTITVRFTGTSN